MMKIKITYFKPCFRLQNCFVPIFLIFIISASFSQNQDHLKNPESLIKELYDQVTFGPGENPDWDVVRNLFIPQASIVLRTGQHEMTPFSLDGWILDFVNFIYNNNVTATGFEEKIITMESLVFGNIAHVLVLYTAYLPGKTKTPREGVDSFHLVKRDGRWWITSILNEIPSSQRPKPEVLNR
jgi:hypothetical protein